MSNPGSTKSKKQQLQEFAAEVDRSINASAVYNGRNVTIPAEVFHHIRSILVTVAYK